MKIRIKDYLGEEANGRMGSGSGNVKIFKCEYIDMWRCLNVYI